MSIRIKLKCKQLSIPFARAFVIYANVQVNSRLICARRCWVLLEWIIYLPAGWCSDHTHTLHGPHSERIAPGDGSVCRELGGKGMGPNSLRPMHYGGETTVVYIVEGEQRRAARRRRRRRRRRRCRRWTSRDQFAPVHPLGAFLFCTLNCTLCFIVFSIVLL